MASVINQINVGGIEYAIAHSASAKCNTSGSTVAKVANIITDEDTTNTSFTLVAGVAVIVIFENTNTASNATLNINGTGAYAMKFQTSTAIPANYIKGGPAYLFMWDGTNWILVSNRPAVEFNIWGSSD